MGSNCKYVNHWIQSSCLWNKQKITILHKFGLDPMWQNIVKKEDKFLKASQAALLSNPGQGFGFLRGLSLGSICTCQLYFMLQCIFESYLFIWANKQWGMWKGLQNSDDLCDNMNYSLIKFWLKRGMLKFILRPRVISVKLEISTCPINIHSEDIQLQFQKMCFRIDLDESEMPHLY